MLKEIKLTFRPLRFAVYLKPVQGPIRAVATDLHLHDVERVVGDWEDRNLGRVWFEPC